VYDDEYVTALPELYSNNPRQFHMDIPCRKMFSRNHQCSNPATLVFRVRGVAVWGEEGGRQEGARRDVGVCLIL